MTSPALRYADITDKMTDLEDARTVRVSGFYKITEGYTPRFMGGGLVRSLVVCLPDDPDMEVVGSTSACGLFHRPWQLQWLGPISWDSDTIELYRTDWRADVQRGDDRHPIRNTTYPEIFKRFKPLTNHERLLIAGWRQDTDARIRDYEARSQEGPRTGFRA